MPRLRGVHTVTPSDVLRDAFQQVPAQACFDSAGHPLVIPADIIDLYGSPTGIVHALGNTLRLLTQNGQPLNVAGKQQQQILTWIADECESLVTRINERARQFEEQFCAGAGS